MWNEPIFHIQSLVEFKWMPFDDQTKYSHVFRILTLINYHLLTLINCKSFINLFIYFIFETFNHCHCRNAALFKLKYKCLNRLIELRFGHHARFFIFEQAMRRTNPISTPLPASRCNGNDISFVLLFLTDYGNDNY